MPKLVKLYDSEWEAPIVVEDKVGKINDESDF